VSGPVAAARSITRGNSLAVQQPLIEKVGSEWQHYAGPAKATAPLTMPSSRSRWRQRRHRPLSPSLFHRHRCASASEEDRPARYAELVLRARRLMIEVGFSQLENTAPAALPNFTRCGEAIACR